VDTRDATNPDLVLRYRQDQFIKTGPAQGEVVNEGSERLGAVDGWEILHQLVHVKIP